MERKDLLGRTKDLSRAKAKASMPSRAARSRCCVGNPANTNCLIRMRNAPGLKPLSSRRWMRWINAPSPSSQQKIGKPLSSIRKVTIGETTLRPIPTYSAECGGKKTWPMINDPSGSKRQFIPTSEARRSDHRGPRAVLRRERGDAA